MPWVSSNQRPSAETEALGPNGNTVSTPVIGSRTVVCGIVAPGGSRLRTSTVPSDVG
jgi:hypothetical protein